MQPLEVVGVYVVLEECGEKNYVQLFHRTYLDVDDGNPEPKYLAIAFKLLKDWQYYQELLRIKPKSVAIYDFEFDLHRQERINWTGVITELEAEQEKLETGEFSFCCELRECPKHPRNKNQEDECPFKANLFQVKLQNPCAFGCGEGKMLLGIDVQRHLVPIFLEKERGWLPSNVRAVRVVSRLN